MTVCIILTFHLTLQLLLNNHSTWEKEKIENILGILSNALFSVEIRKMISNYISLILSWKLQVQGTFFCNLQKSDKVYTMTNEKNSICKCTPLFIIPHFSSNSIYMVMKWRGKLWLSSESRSRMIIFGAYCFVRPFFLLSQMNMP